MPLNAFRVPVSWFIPRRRIGRHDSPSSPVLRSFFNLVPADAHFPEIFLDIFPVLSRSTWPPPETLGFPCESLSRKSIVKIIEWKMSKPSQTFASDNTSSFGSAVASLTFSFVTLSFQEIPRILRCRLWCADSSFFSFGWLRLATDLHCWATWRGLVLHKALFSLANWFSCSSIICLVLRKRQLLCRFAHWLLDHSSQWLICSSQDSRSPLQSQW